MRARWLLVLAPLFGACSGEILVAGEPPGGGFAALPVCINEFMPDNAGALVDETGVAADWIELHNPTGARIDLAGWSLTDDDQHPDRSPLPRGVALDPGGFLVLWADGRGAAQAGPRHLSFWLPKDGGKIGLFAPDGRGSVVAFNRISTDFAAARHPDCCAGPACFAFDYHGTPGRTNTPPKTEPVTLLPTGGTFRYLDTNVPPPADWIRPAFDDGAWKSGRAPLGYGDPHIITQVNGGPDPNNHYITTWFRAAFTVTDQKALKTARVLLLRDDGAAVYLNGVEVARSNLPDGALTPATLAPVGTSGAEETTYFEFPLDPQRLVEGKNVLAVEVHQAAANSSDLGMDCGVMGEKATP